jgi:vanillate O-demethylase ferredoxin subunit
MKELRVRVGEVIDEAEGIRGFTLLPIDGAQLPPPTPGAHIDVHLGVGLTRLYSITNGPGELDHYRIAVKLEPMSRGGSQAMHARVGTGNELSISEPRNNFPLAVAAERHLLFAGGIGITPLLSMARHLAARGASFRLHYFARAPQFAAFAAWLGGCGWQGAVELHYGLDPDTQRNLLHELLAGPQPGHASLHVWAGTVHGHGDRGRASVGVVAGPGALRVLQRAGAGGHRRQRL